MLQEQRLQLAKAIKSLIVLCLTFSKFSDLVYFL